MGVVFAGNLEVDLPLLPWAGRGLAMGCTLGALDDEEVELLSESDSEEDQLEDDIQSAPFFDFGSEPESGSESEPEPESNPQAEEPPKKKKKVSAKFKRTVQVDNDDNGDGDDEEVPMSRKGKGKAKASPLCRSVRIGTVRRTK